MKENYFMQNYKKYIAELIGTFALILFGCGVAIFTSNRFAGLEFVVATSLAFGLSIVAISYSIGNISGAHVNPAVSLAMLILKKLNWKDFIGYVVAQVLGAGFACIILMLFFGPKSGFGANAIQVETIQSIQAVTLSKPLLYIIALLAEIVLTFVFVLTVIGVTDKRFNEGKNAGLVIGGSLTLVHLLGLSLTGTSVNPARSFMPALFALFSTKTPATQIWIFILGPIIGAGLAAFLYDYISSKNEKKAEEVAEEETVAVEEIEPTVVEEVKEDSDTAKE